MKIYLYGWFGFDNVGDNLILQTELDYLSDTFKNNKLIIVGEDNSLRSLIGDYCDFITTPHTGKNYIKMFFQADYIIYGGGGLFPHQNTWQVILLFLMGLIFKFRQKKIMFIGLGVGGRLNKIDLTVWRAILSMAEGAYFRDDVLLRQLGLPPKSHVATMPDIAFLYHDRGLLHLSEKKFRTVSVALANIFEDNEDAYKRFIGEIVLFLQNLIDGGYFVRLYAFTKGCDEHMNHDICTRLAFSNCEAIPYSDTNGMLTEFLQGEYVVAMRFHACILATLACTPFLCLAYSHKLEALCETFGLTAYMFKFCFSRDIYYGEEYWFTSKELISTFIRITIDAPIIKTKLSKEQQAYPAFIKEKLEILKRSIEVNDK